MKNAMQHYLGPYQWHSAQWQSATAGAGWGLPTGCQQAVCLVRPEAQPESGGLAIFAGDMPRDNDYEPLGEADSVLPESVRRRFESRLRLKRRLTGVRVADMVYEVLTEHADVEGPALVPPLMPANGRILQLKVGPRLLRRRLRPGRSREWPLILENLQRHYRDVRQQALQGTLFRPVFDRDGRPGRQQDTGFHRRWLQSIVEQYRVPYRMIQAQQPDEEPLPHSTTIIESFDQADASTVGPLLTWSEVNGDWGTLSGELHKIASTGQHTLRAEHDLSGDNHECQLIKTAGGSLQYWGPCVRHTSSGGVEYYTVFHGGDTLYLRRGIGLSFATVATVSHAFPGDPVTYRLVANGSSLECFVNGVSVLSATDTVVTGTLRCGVFGCSPGFARADSFVAGDLSEMATNLPVPLLMGISQ